jgi:tape measure domain-containing protein
MGETLLKETKRSLGIASPSREFKKIGENVGKGFELGAVGSMDKAFDALERKLQERLKRLQSILSLAPSRRSAFPFVATGGRLESGPIAREIDQAYAKIAQIQERRQGRLATERGSLAQMAGRLLPPARDRSLPAARETIFPGGGALDQVTQGFVQSLRNTRDTLARNFSANTYLPRATRALATSMDVATKQLSGTKIAGLLPSKEMMEPLRFQRAQQKAAQIDAENIARAQAEQALNQQNLRGMFQGVPRINAPRVGQEETPIGRHIQNKIEQAIQNARQTLGLPLGPSSTFVPSPFAGAATVPPRQFFQPTMQAALPPAGGTGPIAAAQRNIAEMQKNNDRMLASTNRAIAAIDRIIEAGRGITGNAPSAPPSQSGFAAWSRQMTAKYGGGNVPPVPPGGGGGGGGRFREIMGFGPDPSRIDLSVFQQARVPLTGAIAELTSEFANAAKQVLLFGTAYKALAFFTNLPNQAFEAAKALGTYKNQLQAVTSESNTFEQSFAFVDNLAQRFNVPLESARQGFVKLYASMEPAGFSQGQIENLFEGISKATAAFGLSADKVDRVNYAFAQMASKGQIMSEELKGQLGDVLPGALALFAEAAQMSIPEFSKAMEDGAFKGDAMAQVLDNVAILMNSKFGPAAQNASKTLQGALNQIQNNLKMMYESLTPFVNQFAAVFGPQVNSLIKDVTDAIKILTGSFVNGSDALSTLSPRAEAIYKVFQQIGPSAVSAAQNIGSFASSLQVFITPLLSATKGVLDFISLPVVARIGLYATIIASLNGAFQLLARTGILQATVAMVKFLATLNIAQLRVYIAGLQTLVAVLRSMITAANIATAAMVALKVAVGGIIVTAILTGLDLLAQRLLNIGDSANKSKQSVRELMQELDQIAGSADVAAATEKYMEANTELAMARRKYQEAESNLRITRKLPVDAGGSIVDVAKAEKAASDAYAEVITATTKLRQARQTRDTATKRKLEEDLRTQQQLKPVDLSAGDEKEKKGKRTPLDQIMDSESIRRLKMKESDLELRIAERIADAKLKGNDAEVASLTNVSKAIKAQSEFSAAREYVLELINKEDQLLASKSLNEIQFANKLEDAKTAMYVAENDLKKAFLVLQGDENELAKEAIKDAQKKLDQQREYNRLLEDAKIEAGLIGPEQAAILLQRRGFEDAQRRAQEAGQDPAELMRIQAAIPQAGSIQESIDSLQDALDKLLSTQEMVKFSANSIGEAFASSFKDAITGAATAQEALAGFFKRVGDAFADMAAQMIQKMIQMYILNQFLNILPGMGSFAGGAKIGQSVSMPTGAGIGAGGGILQNSMGQGFGTFGPNFGIRQFANGGMVTGPTLGLIGEGKYNEAVVPLPDGKTIPVDLGGAAGNQIVSNITVNVNNGQTQSNANGSNSSELGRKLEGAVKQVIVGELRPGGLLAR